MFDFQKIGHRIIITVGFVVAFGMSAMVLFYTIEQEKNIMAQNERAVLKITESVSQALKTVMLAGYADIAEALADSLKSIPDLIDFRILREDGTEAFRDNKTIQAVNQYRGEEDFFPRNKESVVPVMRPNEPHLRETIEELKVVNYYGTSKSGEETLTFLAPIINGVACHKCHGDDKPIRGVLKITASLTEIQEDIKQTWHQSLIILGISIVLIMVLMHLMVNRTVVKPIIKVTKAMRAASRGDLNQRVPVFGGDELSEMANSFNQLTTDLLSTHTGLITEQKKLKTLIQSAQEGMIVTDESNEIVMINKAAEHLLDKKADAIISDGFINLFDNPKIMEEWLNNSSDLKTQNQIKYKGLLLSVSVSQLKNEQGEIVRSSALIRDITAQKKLEDELRTLSNTDGLTLLFNRRYLDQTLSNELERSFRYNTELSILMFDVDHFKKFNDTHGHDQGDRVLQSIAKTMRNIVRTLDVPCRYGGEEFLIIMPGTPCDGALVLAERLREKIETTEVDGLNVTISIGVASMAQHHPTDAEDFITIADEALYKAKENGRNQVVVGDVKNKPA